MPSGSGISISDRAGLDDEAGGLAHQIGGGAAVHGLGAGVDKAHRTRSVEDHDDVRAGFDDAPQGGPVLLQAGGVHLEFHAHAVAFDGEMDGANQQRPGAGGLDHIILGAGAQRPQRDLVVVDPGMNDQGHFGHGGAEAFEGLQAPAVGEVEVEQNGVELAGGKQVQAIGETGSDGEMDVNQGFGAEFRMKQPGVARIVFEDQDFHPVARCSQRLVVVHGSGLPRRGNYSTMHRGQWRGVSQVFAQRWDRRSVCVVCQTSLLLQALTDHARRWSVPPGYGGNRPQGSRRSARARNRRRDRHVYDDGRREPARSGHEIGGCLEGRGGDPEQ